MDAFKAWYATPEVRALVDQTAHEEAACEQLALAAWRAALNSQYAEGK